MYKEHLKVEQPPEYTSRILVYEVGDIVKCLVYIDRHGKLGYVGETKISLADASAMLKLLIEQLGYNLEEVEKLGYDRYVECQNNLGKDGHR